jgi:hypothetical protein
MGIVFLDGSDVLKYRLIERLALVSPGESCGVILLGGYTVGLGAGKLP